MAFNLDFLGPLLKRLLGGGGDDGAGLGGILGKIGKRAEPYPGATPPFVGEWEDFYRNRDAGFEPPNGRGGGFYPAFDYGEPGEKGGYATVREPELPRTPAPLYAGDTTATRPRLAPDEATDAGGVYPTMDEPATTRPRIAPGQPVTQDLPGGRYGSDPLEAAYGRRQLLQEKGVEKEPAWWKRALRGALAGAATGLAGGGGLAGALGGAAAGAGGGGFFPQVEQNIRKQQEIGKTDAEIARLEGKRTAQQKYERGQADIRNIEEDNRRLAEEARRRGETAKETLQTKKRDAFRKRNPFFDASKATPAQVRELAEFGETPESVGTYDFSKRDIKKIGGTTFVYDPNEKKYVDSGLPQAPGEERAEIQIEDPVTGQTLTLTTTSGKKAQMLNSRIVAQMAADAAAKRQASQQAFQATESQKSRAFQGALAEARIIFQRGLAQARATGKGDDFLREKMTDFVSKYTNQNGFPPTPAERKNFMDAMLAAEAEAAAQP